MNLELKVNAPKTQPVVFNYSELKEGLSTALADYKGKAYDESMLAEAKADTANLNKLKKALNDERIFRKKEFEAPFKVFEDQVKELCGMIDEATSGIKAQLDAYEQKRIEEKRDKIESLFAETVSLYPIEFLSLNQIFNEKWLNKTTTEKAIANEITEICEKIIKDLEIINKMPNCSFEAKECYKTTLDLNKAIAEGERIAQIQEQKRQAALAKAQEEIEARKHIEELNNLPKEEPHEVEEVHIESSEPCQEIPEKVYDLTFKCSITKPQAFALKQFCDENGIKLIRI